MDFPNIIVFTRDLRVRDNPALEAAVSMPGPTVALFVFDELITAKKSHSSNRFQFLIDSLRDLDASLKKIGSQLIIREGKWIDEITKVVEETQSKQIHVSNDFSLLAKTRLELLVKKGESNGFGVSVHPGVSLVEPGRLTPADGREYKVFTPYYRRWLETSWRKPLKTPKFIQSVYTDGGHIEILEKYDQKNLSPFLLKGGETEGVLRLNDWITKEISDYEKGRDDIEGDRTSRLSPYLHFGCLSSLEVALQALKFGGDAFVRQLCWRDFYLQILHYRPDSSRKDYRDRKYDWNKDSEAFRLWKEGKTGFPIVDAGMRQLLAEGFMHNRVRMIVASFLTKDLHLDWRIGAEHFMNYLVDGDVASNQLNWQWVAGTGTDSNPHRIFNPIRQSERFDADGKYIRKWVPELKNILGNEVHNPDRKLRLEASYPEAMVDHHEAIAIYKSKYSG